MAARIWTLLTALAWLAFCAAAAATPLFLAEVGQPSFGRAIALQIISVAVGVVLLSALLLTGERAEWPAWARWLLFIAGAAVVVTAWKLNIKGPLGMATHALGLAALALPIGYWLGSQMQKVTHLIPLGIAMSAADIFSVAVGPSHGFARHINAYQTEVAQKTADIMHSLPPEQAAQAAGQASRAVHLPLAAYLVANMPLAGQGATAPVLGIGDFVALAFLFRAAWVHRLRPGLVFCAALGSTLVALTLAQLLHLALPALPLICAGTLGTLILVDARMRRLDRQEIMLSVGVVALFGALLAARWFAP